MGIDKKIEVGNTSHRVRIDSQTINFDYSDFEAAGTSDTLDGTAVANCIPIGGALHIANLFGAPDASAAAITCGDSGDADGIITSTNVWDGLGGDGDGDGDGDVGDTITTPADFGTYHATYTPRITLSLTGDNCEDLTTGSGKYTFHYIQLVADT